MKTERKAIPVSYLNPKDEFEFVNLSEFRNCSVKRNSEAGTWIFGEHRNGKDGAWKPLVSHVISNNSMVYAK